MAVSRPYTVETSPGHAAPVARPNWAAVALLWLAFVYLWVLPLVRPRGGYLWGHYRLADLLLGVPLGFATLGATAVLLSPAHRRRGLGLRLAAVGLSVLLGAAAIDVLYCFAVARVWRANAWYDDQGMIRAFNPPDPELGYARLPHLSYYGDPDLGNQQLNARVYYRTDRNGFRNAPGIHQADVAFIGDSFTEAVDIPQPQTFVQLAGTQTGLKVVNLGRTGYGPQQEAIVLQRYGLAYHPRFVVWQLWEGNDLTDAEHYVSWIHHPERSKTTLLQRYQRHSPLMQLLNRTLARPPARSYGTLHLTGGESVRLTGQSGCDPDVQAQYPIGLPETEKAIERTYRLCRSNGIQLVVLCFPHRECVWAPSITFDSPSLREKSFPAGVDGPRGFAQTLKRFCTKIGCPCIDTQPALRQREVIDNRRLFFLRDVHLDVEGHKVIAGVVANWLRSQPQRHPFTEQARLNGRAAASIER